MTISAKDLIKSFGLRKHPEGGYFSECYRSTESISRRALPSRYKGPRSFSTSIYFLLPPGAVSQMHRIASDEIWHFYLGGALELVQLSPEGILDRVILGQKVMAGERVQHVVPAGYWFAARPHRKNSYSFVGCTVAPGFDFADFELAEPRDLFERYPGLKEELRPFVSRNRRTGE